jgi:hypothetical protein
MTHGKHVNPEMCDPETAPRSRNFVRCSIVCEVRGYYVNCLEATFHRSTNNRQLCLPVKVEINQVVVLPPLEALLN